MTKDFATLRNDVQRTRDAAAEARGAFAAARDWLASLRASEKELQRHGAKKKELQILVESIGRAQAEVDKTQKMVIHTTTAAVSAASAFAQVSDPRTAINHWKDTIPILMLPVRIETRYNKRDPQKPELLVRIYPDDCSIDSFEPGVSETEVESAKAYWLSMAAAGGHVDQQRGAWRALAGGYGAGRAEWIISSYIPLNLVKLPNKPKPADLILTIGTETPLVDAEAAAIGAYWREVWLANGDQTQADKARDVLIAALGNDAARAEELIATYVPSNIRTKFDKSIDVQTALVVFPPPGGAKRRSWSRPSTAELLPDVFVFIGYNGGVQELFQLGQPVVSPLVVSPDPSAPPTQQLRHGPDGELIFPDEMQWMVDFNRAVAAGMGMRISLTPAALAKGFERVLVIGLRLSSDEGKAQSELETLITHQRFSRAGYSLLPQGTPTNNTESGSSGWSSAEDPDPSFDTLTVDKLFSETPFWADKADGQWLAEALGIAPKTLYKIAHSGGHDQAEARAMNTALWPATFGYWMNTMMSPVFDDAAAEETRKFFRDYVLGRGGVPAVRIGNQPYGILPATAYSRMQWLNPSTEGRASSIFHYRLYQILKAMDGEWKNLSANVSFAGKAGDPHQLLLDILGLHSGSVEFAQRYAESIKQLYNRLKIEGLGGLISLLVIAGLMQQATNLLATSGYGGDPPDVLEKFFFGDHNALKGPLIDDRPLSETARIRNSTLNDKNYIEWLIGAARKSLDTLYKQEGFRDDKPPEALLYLLLRHALQLGYHDVSVRLHLIAGLLNTVTARQARIDGTFIHVSQSAAPFESRYGLLYKPEPLITGDPQRSIGDYIGGSVDTLTAAAALREQLVAMERLASAPTARLERTFAEHIDLCSYRLDAWMLGLVSYQLSYMRNTREGSPGAARQGIYVGAYAWIENLKPDNRVLTPVTITDPAVAKDFASGSPLVRDSLNEGHLHAPSLNHAVAASVLRNGYIANATPGNPTSMAVNLTSTRVRRALGILEGIRGGQSLGALLGYQLERGLHDNHTFGVELDELIFKLRREFPLGGNRLASTKIDADDLAIESVEARNVVDGLALVNHIRTSGNSAYPFGKTRLPPATAPQAAAIDAEVAAMLETWDATADLAMSEGVFQAVVGNYDRVASTLDAYAKGNFPPEPLVVRSPTQGLGLTHRVAVHFETGAAAGGANPRAVAEPSLDRWLGSVLPAFTDVGCLVDYRDAANDEQTHQVLLDELHVGPSDLLQLLREDKERSLAELDERIMAVVAPLARPDAPMTIRYMETNDASVIPLFELLPLVRQLRRLTSAARPLRNTDMSMSTEARRDDDADVSVDRARIDGPRGTLNTLFDDLKQFNTAELEPQLGDVVANRAAILSNIDPWIDSVIQLLGQAALFSIPQSGWGFAYDGRGRIFHDLVAKAADTVTHWNTRLADYDAAIAAYDALPGPTPAEERLAKLAAAERMISTKTISPAPATPADYRTALDGKRAAFVAKRDALAEIRDTTHLALSDLVADFQARLPVDDFDYPPLSIAEQEDQIIALAQDIQRVVLLIARECDLRVKAVDKLLAQHDGAAGAVAKVNALADGAKALFGDDFVIIPELDLATNQGDEIEAAFGATATLLDHVTNTLKIEQPVDTWMYGVARTRERMRRWEQIVMLAESFGASSPELQPLQFPFDPNDRWMALQFPPDLPLDHERLLYTAHFSQPFDKTQRQCGLLLDEWTEVIPAAETTTGLAFHYDRPNNEAPQTMLLLTPAAFHEVWQWNDVVDALNETLDLAKRRAVEPVHIDTTAYAQFLPATIMAVTINQLTISANLALNNNLGSIIKP